MWKIKNLNHPGNCVLYSVITSMAKESEKEWIHIYIYIIESICYTSETNTIVSQLCVLSHFSFDASPHHTLSQCSEKCVKVLVALLCPTLCDPMDCSLPGSLVQWILQARAREWVVPFSRGSSQPKDQTHVSCGSCIAGRFFFFTPEPPGKPHMQI